MKTILILTLAFGIQISGLMAGNSNEVVTPSEPSELFCPECIVLSPTVPMEAAFVEQTEFDFSMNLIPDVPMIAEFDNGIEVELAANSFSPILPTFADFDEAMNFTMELDHSFAPVVPTTANFSDTL